MEKINLSSTMKRFSLPAINTKPGTVILANGQFPSHIIPLSILDNADYIVCCDGAVDQINGTNIHPSAIVGDLDSLSIENKKKYNTILFDDKDQETNDLTKAVNFCAGNGRKHITILGATGKREDHTLGNISLLAEYMDICDIEMVTDYGVFNPIDSDSHFDSFREQQVSVFSIGNLPITAHNLRYPIENRVFTNWWQGTLNESLEDNFIVYTKAKTIIFRTF